MNRKKLDFLAILVIFGFIMIEPITSISARMSVCSNLIFKYGENDLAEKTVPKLLSTKMRFSAISNLCTRNGKWLLRFSEECFKPPSGQF